MERAPDQNVPSSGVQPDGSNFGSLAALRKLLSGMRVSLSLDTNPLEDDICVYNALKAWLQAFFVFGFQFERYTTQYLLDKVLKTLGRVKEAVNLTGWLAYFKFRNASFFSVWNGQVQPRNPYPSTVCPNPRYLFGGAFTKFIRLLYRQGRMDSFSFTILQSKKGMPRPTDKMVETAIAEHIVAMTTVPEDTVAVIDPSLGITGYLGYPYGQHGFEIGIGPDRIRTELSRTVDEIFKDFDIDLDALSSIVLPSGAANVKHSRGKFGTWASLVEAADGKPLQEFSDAVFGEEGRLKFQYRMAKLSGYVGEYYGEQGKEELKEFGELSATVIGCEIGTLAFLQAWKKFFWGCVKMAINEEPLVKVVGLKEALKIRCISKGPPLTYFVLKSTQKTWWSQLQKFKCFELTGTPVSEELINERFQAHLQKGTCDFHSGDYKSATDNLKPWVSETINNRIWDLASKKVGFPLEVFRELSQRALTGHTYVVGSGARVPQRCGQLMGSIISFPILCIANAALCRLAYEVSHCRTISLRALPAWFNGDDCLTLYERGKPYHTVWKACGNVMGLEDSLGKTYDSPRIGTVNSVLFVLEGTVLKQVPYVNLGFFESASRSSYKEDVDEKHERGMLESIVLNHGICQNELLGTCPPFVEERVQALYLYIYGDALKKFKGPWFLPRWLGGLGMKDFNKCSRDQLYYATCARKLLAEGVQGPQSYISKDWALFDVFNKNLTSSAPLVGEYPFQVCDRAVSKFRDSTEAVDYGTAFKAVVWEEFLLRGFTNLLNVRRTPEEECLRTFDKFHRAVLHRVSKSNVLKLMTEEELGYEKKCSVRPVWAEYCTYGIDHGDR